MLELKVLKTEVNRVILEVQLEGRKGARIYRSRRKAGPYEEVGVAYEETFVDTTELEPGKRYYYRVGAHDAFEASTLPRDTSLRKALLEHLDGGSRLISGGMFLLLEDFKHFGTQVYRREH